MNVLVLNCGSATIKIQLIAIEEGTSRERQQWRLARGMVDRLGPEALVVFEGAGGAARRAVAFIPVHRAAVEHILGWVCSPASGLPDITKMADIRAVGHRVVHGGSRFARSTLVDDDVLTALETLGELAPLHNPPAVSGIRASREILGPKTPMVAVFNTAFHHTIPKHAHSYAIPHEMARRYGLRRYGFHGTPHRYVAERYAEISGTRPDQVNINPWVVLQTVSRTTLQEVLARPEYRDRIETLLRLRREHLDSPAWFEGSHPQGPLTGVAYFMEDSGQPFDVALAVTRAGNLFTTHTPVPAGFDRFAPALPGLLPRLAGGGGSGGPRDQRGACPHLGFRRGRRALELILAGKAHPADGAGQAMIVDLWINTPRRPWEASGTSGMKVLVNGGLNLSKLDGWWAEAYAPEVGWALGDGREHGGRPRRESPPPNAS